MRIIAGIYRSRTLEAPEGLSTRPTSDRLRETLFNILAPRIEGAHFLDLYAGSGAVALEALSRRAAHVELVEKAPSALKVLRGNFARLGVKSGYQIYESSVVAALKKILQRNAKNNGGAFDLIFLDPPYDAAEEYSATLESLGGPLSALLATDGMLIAEHRRKVKLAESYGLLTRTRLREQGDAALSFYGFRVVPPDESAG